MANVLVLYSSPISKEKSVSSAITKSFVEEYKKINKNDEIVELDLNELEMATHPMNSNNFSDFFNDELSGRYIDILKKTNKLIISAPMINFNVPAVLKNFIDRICVANKTFSYKYAKKGSSIGLLSNLKVQIIASQGAPCDWYPWASHISYLEGIWNFLGAEVSETLLIDATKVEPFNSYSIEQIIKNKINKIKERVMNF
ncbi:FMN-dependent NADH-azoreductase [Mycoplasma sp. 1781]